MTVIDELGAARLVPVVVVTDEAEAGALGDALVAGGLPVAEVTLRTPAGLGVIRALAARGDVLVGAGTVRTASQVDEAVAAGARFVVSPGLSAAVVRRCQDAGVAVVPGIATASELMAALDLGVTTVKFFPAEASGGVPALKALAAPFGDVTFVPTGGIGPSNLADYLSLPFVAAAGGSWMVPTDALAARNLDTLTALVTDAVHLARSIR